MSKINKIALLFPGQGAQYPGMGKEFFESFSAVRETFQESDDLLDRNLSDIILNGPRDVLTHTRNSQTAIFVMSAAVLRVIMESFPAIAPHFCAGLSLGEYTALHAAQYLSFQRCLPLVQYRAEYMNRACESTKGSMAVVIGLAAHEVEELVRAVNMPDQLWTANFNCPGQVVISGTLQGIEAGSIAAKERGAKRVLPLQVHGAFHSGLMREAEERLKPHIENAPIQDGSATLVMNVTGAAVKDSEAIKENLIRQVTHTVRWEQCVRFMMEQGAGLFIEVGCGKTLTGFNKRIGIPVPTVNVEQPKDLETLAQFL